MYMSLNVSPKKKRAPSSDDETVTSPKRIRKESFASLPKFSTSRATTTNPFLPTHLARVQTIHSSLQHALSLALATSAVSPSVDTGRVPNVLNHYSLSSATGFTVTCDLDDIRRLCWLWEWDGTSNPSPSLAKRKTAIDDEDNPFLVPETPTDWIRGGMGFVITPATHFSRAEGKRLQAYGIGIEVEMDLAEGKGGGMAAVARWTSEGESRRQQLDAKLRTWVKLNAAVPVPQLPLADLPTLPTQSKQSSLTKLLAKSDGSSPPKTHPVSAKRAPKEFAVPFPVTPQTPSATPTKDGEPHSPLTPQTPAQQTGSDAATAPQTPTTSRRAALYERIRQKSLNSTPSSNGSGGGISTAPMSKDKMRLLGQEELKRRCLLGRLDEVAATVWALFSSPAQTSSTPLSVARKRRTMQTQVVVRALVSSAPVPISISDAQESITLLTDLCPFFLRPLVIAGEDWLEMPASNPTSSVTPPSPRHREESAQEVLNRSPKMVKIERGGLREVRERIRKELELND